MNKGRLEAFSDGVIAIIITIMVLDMKVPHGATLHELLPLWHDFASYALSFIYVGIYWNNHHHLLQAVTRVKGGVLWANLHLLFWLSLLPFVSGWMGENNFAPLTVALYGCVLMLAAIAYFVLVRALLACHDSTSLLARAIGSDAKGRISVLIYAVGIPLAFWLPWLSALLYALVALLWLVPDRRIEKALL